MRLTHGIVVILLFNTLSGCSTDGIYRKFNVGNGSGALVDIKQRAIIVSKQDRQLFKGDTQPTKLDIICAEPSPDALSAYAAALGAKIDVLDKAKVDFNSNFGETSQFVGLRTQSIQLLRDSFYRICEGYMNRALDPIQYNILMRRYQKYTVALLGIEQLTGAVRSIEGTKISPPPPPAETEKPGQTSPAAEAPKTPEPAKADQPPKASEAAKADEQPKATEKPKAAEPPKAPEKPKASEEPPIDQPPQTSKKSEVDFGILTAAVKEIVLNILNTDDEGQLCFAYLSADKVDSNSPIYQICKQHLTPTDLVAQQCFAYKSDKSHDNNPTLDEICPSYMKNIANRALECNNLYDQLTDLRGQLEEAQEDPDQADKLEDLSNIIQRLEENWRACTDSAANLVQKSIRNMPFQQNSGGVMKSR